MTITKKSIELVEKFSNARGISGFEDEVVALVHEEMDKDFNVSEDTMRNVYMQQKTNTGERSIVQLDAHSDEVGFIVQAIKPNGTLVFLNIGAWIVHNAAAQKVLIRNRDGAYISGIIASKPKHFVTDAEKNNALTLNDLVIDIGASSKEEVEKEYKISIGAPVVPDTTFHYDEQKELFFGKAFDCRIGLAALIETMHRLQSEHLALDVVGTVSAQEEVGTRGAQVAVKKVQPQVAIVFEGAPADDTFTEDYLVQSALKKGPMLRYFDASAIINPRFQQYALDIATQVNIPVQVSVRAAGGTNAAPINLFAGTPTIVIGIPVRYAHTPHCYASVADYEHAIQLAVEIVKNLDEKVIATF